MVSATAKAQSLSSGPGFHSNGVALSYVALVPLNLIYPGAGQSSGPLWSLNPVLLLVPRSSGPVVRWSLVLWSGVPIIRSSYNCAYLPRRAQVGGARAKQHAFAGGAACT